MNIFIDVIIYRLNRPIRHRHAETTAVRGTKVYIVGCIAISIRRIHRSVVAGGNLSVCLRKPIGIAHISSRTGATKLAPSGVHCGTVAILSGIIIASRNIFFTYQIRVARSVSNLRYTDLATVINDAGGLIVRSNLF